jgi:hypothetical protein
MCVRSYIGQYRGEVKTVKVGSHVSSKKEDQVKKSVEQGCSTQDMKNAP